MGPFREKKYSIESKNILSTFYFEECTVHKIRIPLIMKFESEYIIALYNIKDMQHTIIIHLSFLFCHCGAVLCVCAVKGRALGKLMKIKNS